MLLNTLAAATSKGLLPHEDPTKRLRALWFVLLCVAPVCLLYAGQYIKGGAPLGGLQSLLIVIALPISVAIILALLSGIRWILQDYSHMTREQIRAAFVLQPQAPQSAVQ